MLYRRVIISPSDGYYTENSELTSPQKDKVWINAVLFIATAITTTAVGAIMEGANPFTSITGFAKGLPFSITLLLILGIHEFGHYFAAKYWKVKATLPYFIPAPFLPIGTFGAVIKMKSSIPSRKALVDVGSAGPIAGFVVAVAATIIGLKMSAVVSLSSQLPGSIIFGESILFKALSYLQFGTLPPNSDIMLHPIAFAGWLGLFVTALNLIPFGQLDGGHIMFALSPRLHELLRLIRIPLLILLGLTFWSGWYVWALLLLFIGGSHPYPDYMDNDIGIVRKIIAVFSIIMFIVCIMPAPVK